MTVINMKERQIRMQEAAGEIPDFIDRTSIANMTDTQLDQFLDALRIRRLASQVLYEKTLADMAEIAEEKAKGKLEKKCNQIFRRIEQINNHIDVLEKYMNELKGLRIEAGLSME